MLAEIVLTYVNISIHFDATDSRAAAKNDRAEMFGD